MYEKVILPVHATSHGVSFSSKNTQDFSVSEGTHNIFSLPPFIFISTTISITYSSFILILTTLLFVMFNVFTFETG